MKMMSLFDGSGGFPLAAAQCGITPIMASEVEPYPIAVTTSRFPQMRHLGDISKIDGSKLEPVQIITFGSPCQDLSVAGKRAGMKHEDNGDTETTRSGLFMEAVRIIKEMRRATHGKYPKFAVWENVPGAFSSNAGHDFRTVLEEIIKISEPTAPALPMPEKGKWAYADCIMGDGWSVAYRVFDAQYWGRTVLDRDSGAVLKMGTPQRRRRIYLVADFTGRSAGKVLFEREGLRWHLTESGAAWQGAAGEAQGSAGAADREVAATLYASYGTKWNGNAGAYNGENFVIEDQTFILDNIGGQQEYGKESTVNGTLRAGAQGAVAHTRPEPFSKSGRAQSAEHATTWKPGTVANTLNTFDLGEARANEIVVSCIDGDKIGKAERAGGSGLGIRPGDKMYTLTAKDVHAVAYGISSYDSNAMKSDNPRSGIYEASTSRTIDLNGGNPACNQGGIAVVEVEKTSTARLASGGNVAGCLMASGYDKLGAQEMFSGDYTVVEEHPTYCATTGYYMQVDEEMSPTLKARDYKDPNVVCYGLDRASFNQGANAQFGFSVLPEQQPTLTAKGPGAVSYWDGGQTTGTLTANNAGGSQRMPDKENFNCIIENKPPRYIVRRLTPTECARLQGFPDAWGYP